MAIIKSNSIYKRGNLLRFPLLPLRDIVMFPHMVIPLFVGREKSIHALEYAMGDDKHIFLATQKNAKIEDPVVSDIYQFGTICQILQLLKLPDGTVKVLVEGKSRGVILNFSKNIEYFMVDIEQIVELQPEPIQVEALVRSIRGTFENYTLLTKNIPRDVLDNIISANDPSILADKVAGQLKLKIIDKQELLASNDICSRLERLIAHLESEIEILEIENKIRARVKKQMEKTQKEYYLNEQMRAIQKELGSKDEFKQELRNLEEKIEKKLLTDEAKFKSLSELKKLKLMSPMSAEAAVVRNYLDWMLSLPWEEFTQENYDINKAELVLNADHFGLDNIKERILEYLAVNKLVKNMKGPILCLVGPPGVGKTSLARSIAKATNRNFVKMSLGGLRDESEIRGHRRTYIGAMPGKIIHNLKKCNSSNPVFLLDEIDKLSSDFRGDPSSALLDALDPEQNSTFCDHYLDVEYDLSKVMFIATANSIHSIPRALIDRLEVIKIDGYTELEKLSIAKHYLVPKQIELNGLIDGKIHLTDRAIIEIIRYYTRESGVRSLEREIATVCRKIACRRVKGDKQRSNIQPRHIRELLGMARFKTTAIDYNNGVGLVTGLAWTEMGGELLKVEVAVLPGQGKLTITGKLGEIMQESAMAAMSYVRSRADILGLELNFYQQVDIHVHVPEGAIPKDGPSAGITIATALVSALTKREVIHSLAMTGEVTLRGQILPVGGLKEKLLAARRAQIKIVLVPYDNEKDLQTLPNEILNSLKIRLVRHMDEVLALSLLDDLVLSEDMTLLGCQSGIVSTAH